MFSKSLATKLSGFDKESSYLSLNTYYSKLDQLKALWYIPRANCVFSINGTITESRVFDLALKNNVPIMVLWAGTDVLKAIENFQLGNFNEKYIHEIKHFCEAPWVQEELKTIGINAEILYCATANISSELIESESNQLTILGYIPENRSDFYGINQFIKSAKLFPKVRFLLAGSSGAAHQPLPPNVEALGWVEDMNELFIQSQVTMRYIEHDGLSNFVRESLGRGKQVLYSYPLQHCIHCPSEEVLFKEISNLLQRFERNEDLVNYDGISFIRENFTEEKVLANLVKKIKSAIGK